MYSLAQSKQRIKYCTKTKGDSATFAVLFLMKEGKNTLQGAETLGNCVIPLTSCVLATLYIGKHCILTDNNKT